MRKIINYGVTTLGFSVIFSLTSVAHANTCQDLLGLFDSDGRTLEAIHIDAATTLNEDHVAILTETSGELPTQSAFYAGPTDQRKEAIVTQYRFDPDLDRFMSHQNVRVSKVLKGPLYGPGERYVGVWSNGLKAGDSGYFLYLKVIRDNKLKYTIVHKECFDTFDSAVSTYPELNSIFNSGQPDQLTRISNIETGALSQAESHIASSISTLAEDVNALSIQVNTLLPKIQRARMLKVSYIDLGKAIGQLRTYSKQGAIGRHKIERTYKKAVKQNKTNLGEQVRVNTELKGL